MDQPEEVAKSKMAPTEIIYKVNQMPSIDAVIEVYNSSGIKRPTGNYERIAKMYQNSNLVVCAFHKDVLVGVARSLTDYSYCCYLSDLAVKLDYQKLGIGKKLIEVTKDTLGDEVTLILLAAPSAVDYYPKIGFDRIENGFIIHRKPF